MRDAPQLGGSRGEAVGTGMARRLAEPGIILPALAPAQRIVLEVANSPSVLEVVLLLRGMMSTPLTVIEVLLPKASQPVSVLSRSAGVPGCRAPSRFHPSLQTDKQRQ